MAGSTINFTQSATSGSYIDGKIVWTSELDTSDNSSRVIAKLYVRKANTTMTLTTPTTGTWSCNITVDGKQYAPSISASVLEDWVYLTGLTVGTVKHTSNGSKSIVISGSVTAPSGTSLAGHSTSGSDTVQLDFNPRATTLDSLTFSSDYVDGVITANYTPQSPDYYNRCIVYVNVNGTLTNIYTQKLDKQPASQQKLEIQFDDDVLSKIYDKVTNTAQASIQVTFQTYSDSGYTKQIGSNQSRKKSLLLPTSIVPTVSLTAKPANSNSWLTSKGIYVAGSDVTLTWSSAPGKGSGVKLVSTAFTLDGLSLYDGGDKEQGSVTLSGVLKKAGSYKIVAKATDSRGRSATAPKTLTVLSYSAPAITTVQVERGTYNNGWVEAEDGPDVRVLFKTNLSLADNGNTYSAAFKIDGSAKSPNQGATTGLKSGANCTVYFLGLDGEVSHNLAVTVTDSVGSTASAKLTVPTTYITVEYRANGKGIAFGKTSEKDAFECMWPAHFGDAVYIMDKITCPNAFSLRNFNINCNWADGFAHDMIVRNSDGLTLGLGWSGSGDDGKSHETVLDVRPKKANFRGMVTAPHGRFTATTDLSAEAQNDVALRVGDETGQHIDIDSNEIQAKQTPTTPGPLYLNLDGGDVFANGFRIPQIQRGSVRITPSAANTPTSMEITFEKEFSGTPTVIVAPYTAVPGTVVTGAGVNGASSKGCTIWVTRTNTTETVINWIAIY